MPHILVLSTCADLNSAEQLAETLLSQRLAACINILPGARSLYVWKGTMQRDNEVVLLIKTHTDRLEKLKQVLPLLHPYELPELIAVPIDDGLPAYLGWLDQQLGLQPEQADNQLTDKQ